MSNPNPKANGLFAELTARMADVNLGDLDEPIDEVRDDEEVVYCHRVYLSHSCCACRCCRGF